MASATVRGVTINYEVFGEDGPWVALMTGGRRGYGEFKSLAGKLSVEGFRVLLHDRRNTGASSIAMSADEVEEAVWGRRFTGIAGPTRRVAGFRRRLVVRCAHLDPIRHSTPRFRARPVAAAGDRRPVRGQPPARALL